ncbi:CRISPR-associated endoribonuclease Cas6 [Gramella sp. AN32]|uniref:CRISPR-associated endoribonuclease Cas6 n=1 Tax=Christiangramia antarctica TaxID=2058158 RepID=A0ABW5X6N0_9FLAO|nr:CRISPR-associated endoribonuclease Cas6 [Gramella sp. AN32]MCM4154757.1 CRISPR-associated endoribonuclease Cas6 [Gramella sp. AN32]
MRFKITLVPISKNPIIPINYQYPLSAVIYKVLSGADEKYASFLHEKGYQVGDGLKRFKFFTFSDLRAKFKLRDKDRMHLHSNPELIVSFYLPEAAKHFIKGIFLNREIAIADGTSKALFLVEQVEALLPLNIPNGSIDSLHFDVLSMVVCGRKNDDGNYVFLSPEDPNWKPMVLYNWKEKCRAASLDFSETEWAIMDIETLLDKKKPASRLIVIKAGTKAQTRIKGYRDFGIRATGPSAALELLYNAGCGAYTSLGCGFLGIKENWEINHDNT